MKNTNPFNVPGTPIARLGQRSDARVKLVVAAVVVATVVLFSGLFIQGCQRTPATNAANGDNPAMGAAPDTSGAALAEHPVGTNAITPAAPETSTSNAIASATSPSDASTPSTGAPASPTKDYTVVKGDSCYKIAKANHVTMKALTDANPGIDSGKLKIGQTLKIPQAPESVAATAPASTPATGAKATASMASASLSTSTSLTGEANYVVKSGDTLGHIAKTHGTTVKAIKVANGLTSDRIPVGKTLKLPPAKAPAVAPA